VIDIDGRGMIAHLRDRYGWEREYFRDMVGGVTGLPEFAGGTEHTKTFYSWVNILIVL